MGGVVIGVAVGAVVGGAAAAIQSGGDFNAIWKGALVGAAGGAVAGWAAPALSGLAGAAPGAINAVGAIGAGMLGGAVSGIGNVALNGGSGDDYLRQGLMGAGIGGATAGVTYGIGQLGTASTVDGAVANAPATGATPGAEAGTQGITTGATGVAPAAESLTSGATPIGTGTEAVSGSVFPGSAPVDASGIPLTQAGQYAFDDAIGASLSSAPTASAPTSFGMDTSFSGVPKFAGSDASFGSFGSAPVPEGGGLFNAGFGDGLSPVVAPSAPQSPGELNFTFDDYPSQAMIDSGVANPTNTAANAPSDWSMDKLFSWDTAKDIGKGLLMSGGGKSLLGGVMKGMAIPNARSAAQQNNQQLMDLYNMQKQGYQQQLAQQQADAARNQQIYEQNKQAFQNNLETQAANRALLNEQQANAAGYNKQLSETYSNPNAYLNTPEAQAARSMAMQKLLAQNTAAGRRSAGLGLQNQLMMSQLGNLGAYRQGLNSAIRYPGYLGGMSGMSYAPQTTASAAGMLNTLSSAQQWNPDFQTAAGLSSIFY